MKQSFRYFIYLFVLCGIIRLSLTFITITIFNSAI